MRKALFFNPVKKDFFMVYENDNSNNVTFYWNAEIYSTTNLDYYYSLDNMNNFTQFYSGGSPGPGSTKISDKTDVGKIYIKIDGDLSSIGAIYNNLTSSNSSALIRVMSFRDTLPYNYMKNLQTLQLRYNILDYLKLQGSNNLIDVDISGSIVDIITMPMSSNSMKSFKAKDCLLNTNQIDLIFESMYKGGNSGGTLNVKDTYITGFGSKIYTSRTSASDTYYNALIARNWTIIE